MGIEQNIEEIRKRMAAACARSDRRAEEVALVAVSKTKPAEMIEAAAAAGQTLFGESYVQEFTAKQEEVRSAVTWHFIGGLQGNKVKYLRGRVSMIHSVDRLSLAQEIDRQWGILGEPLDILLQANIGGETSKSGTSSDEELFRLAREVSTLPNLRVRGLMTLPPYEEDPEQVRPYFRRLRELAEEIETLALPGVEMRELSMGMSHDFEVAIEEGATLVRVGSAIFGEREKK
ncbi:YggS family pyridoxal phosphate-dependent enzyme [Trichloromonas sp.]|uniref:YggS family pyridoxal phosphate-dependent enzyme n=1 Tax=Trichloromonas sp. TaxID=3069249 RepID=UPI003D817E97